MKARIPWNAVRLLGGVALLAWVVSGTDWRALASGLVTPWLLLIIAGLPFVGAALDVFRLQVLYRAQNLHLPFGIGFRVAAISALVNFAVPGAAGGDLVKVWYLNSVGCGGPEMAAIWFMDRLTGLLSLLLFVAAAGFAASGMVQADPLLLWLHRAGLVAAGVSLLAVLLSGTRLVPWGVSLFARFPAVHTLLSRAAESLTSYHRHPGILLLTMLFSLASHGVLLLTLVAEAAWLMPEAGAARVTLLSLFGLFANAVPITPGGLGVGEAAFDGLFHRVGIDGGSQLLLLWRIGMIPICSVGGIYYAMGLHRPSPAADPAQPSVPVR
ncbi:MAG: lysylphosphatidylglycerol synthase transmembrane domain-containing protein [Vicinamibacterales bacterium]